MSLILSHIDVKDAVELLKNKGCFVVEEEVERFAIAVIDNVAKNCGGYIHGVILMRIHRGECALVHMYTDGTAQAGSLLYGAAWRAAKALGYKQITI